VGLHCLRRSAAGVKNTIKPKKGEKFMDAILHKGTPSLSVAAERVKHGLGRLKHDCSVWARNREERDLRDLMEGLKDMEKDLSLMLTDCVTASCPRDQKAPKAIFDDFREIFASLDALFNALKDARLQLKEAYIHPTMLDYLEVAYGRFDKLFGQVKRHLDEEDSSAHAPLKETGVDLARGM
jgi:hypothetical protein